MPQTAEVVGKVGKLQLTQPANEHGLKLTVRVLSGGSTKAAPQRCTACALTPDGDALGIVTDSGAVYALHLNKQRYVLLDTLPSAGTAAVFMARLSRRLFVGCSSGDIHCFDISSSSARLAKLRGHRAAVSSLSSKSDTEQLLSASADAVLLWDMQVRPAAAREELALCMLFDCQVATSSRSMSLPGCLPMPSRVVVRGVPDVLHAALHRTCRRSASGACCVVPHTAPA
jgi:hypothetical protein